MAKEEDGEEELAEVMDESFVITVEKQVILCAIVKPQCIHHVTIADS